MKRYFIFFKPYHVASQFSPLSGKKTLAHFLDVPKDAYPVGRLDYDSEGLLIVTNDTQLNRRLLNPHHAHEREYWVQVEGLITLKALNELQHGMVINIDGKPHRTLPCKASLFSSAPDAPERNPPIRYRKNIPTSWVKLILTEGKNRQVRKMTAAAGFPTLRLIRYRIEKLTLQNMQSGDVKELSQEAIYALLFQQL